MAASFPGRVERTVRTIEGLLVGIGLGVGTAAAGAQPDMSRASSGPGAGVSSGKADAALRRNPATSAVGAPSCITLR